MRNEDELTAKLERQLAAAQQIAHIGSWEWDVTSNTITWSDELYRIYGLVPQSVELSFERFLSKVHPDDRVRIQQSVGRAVSEPGPFMYDERIVRPDGTIRHLHTIGEARADPRGRVVGLIGTCRDVTLERQQHEVAERARRMREAEQDILEWIAAGAALPAVLARIAMLIEEQAPPTLASILLLDPSGTRVRTGAAPSLPEMYSRAIDGQEIGPRAGSCGTAAFLKRPVFVNDIELDPLWEAWREIARAASLRACWSTPIVAPDGRVLGTFALYYREPRSPNDAELALITRATHIAGIAIHRAQADERLRALSAYIEAVREDERTSMAREIHDELGQALTAIKMDVAWLERRVGDEGALARLGEMRRMTADLIDTVRRIASELRPGLLDDLGLAAAIEWQAQEFERRTETTCIVHAILDAAVVIPRDVATAVFRVFQETLTNVARHAEATVVDVRLEHADGAVRLVVRDDGKGIPAEVLTKPTSLGLLGITERARRLGGTVELVGAPGDGTELVLVVPIVARPP